MKYIVSFMLLVAFVFNGYTQTNLWSSLSKDAVNGNGYRMETESNNFLEFDIGSFQASVKQASGKILLTLPVGGGEIAKFQLTINTVMAPELMVKFPEIRAFNGVALDGSHYTAKVSINAHYFRAMILRPGEPTIFIDPAIFTDTVQNHYLLYTKEALLNPTSFTCHLEKEIVKKEEGQTQVKSIQSCELRTYRLAVSATAEYTNFQGGSVADAIAAQVTTINRVNSVYERDLAITLTIIGANDKLIYTNAANDPFTNGSPGAMINENQMVITDSIGAANYDIGHVFGTDSGGLASLGCVCYDNYKARGVTGSHAPTGDAFDIDYVAHEMGHQFSANHSFNNFCGGNRNPSTAVEPGSGSTIMGYAGVCNPNVQLHSDAYFHAVSLGEIGVFLNGYGSTCAVITPLNNDEPAITSISGNLIIPAQTPFMLKASATDVDGDIITYDWEQMDNEIAPQPPLASSEEGPSFRSFEPTTMSVRYFPSILNQITNTYIWERLSNASRTYNFRLTVRDNSNGGGCTSYDDIFVTTDANSGPFLVTYPNALGIVWTGHETRIITWDVANTDAAPINCSDVNISISLDGGTTFTTLISNTPNDGSEAITVPNTNSTKAIILVSSVAETFFDISNRLFKIVATSAGIVEENNVQLRLYPNPTTGLLQLAINEGKRINGYQIINIYGKVVLSNDKKIATQSIIDVSSLSRGLYFFQTRINGQEVVRKLIKK